MSRQIQGQEEAAPREMKLEDVLQMLRLFQAAGIEVWLDGGWGVSALIGEPIRQHRDMDIAVRDGDLVSAKDILSKAGFAEVDGGKPWNFVMADGRGHEIDFHVVTIAENGDGLYGPPERGMAPYPASAFTGKGSLDGVSIRCISAEYQMESHSGYAVDDDDFRDVSRINERFGIPIPEEYRRWLGDQEG